MKNLIVVCLFIFALTSSTFANNPDTLDYTVMAPSGLSLRTAPYLTAERLDILPYGTSVKTVGYWEEVYDLQRMDTVDARVGYWIETAYQGQKGYVFSGYLKTGPLYVPSTTINRDFRITAPGERCQAINYDPTLHWYGIFVDPVSERTRVKEVDLSIEQTALTEADKEMAYADLGDFIQVNAQQKDSFLLFFGTLKPIDTDQLAFEKSYFDQLEVEHWDQQGKFIYPYERVQVGDQGYAQYYLLGHERVSINPEPQAFEDSLTRRYELYLTTNHTIYGNEEDLVNIGKELNTEHLSDYQYATYLGPRLVWQGDINNDGFPDMIFYTPYMSECCGGSVTYQLLVSEYVDGKWVLKKAAADEIFSCYGC